MSTDHEAKRASWELAAALRQRMEPFSRPRKAQPVTRAPIASDASRGALLHLNSRPIGPCSRSRGPTLSSSEPMFRWALNTS